MLSLLRILARRMRPRAGWSTTLLALVAAAMPGVAAADASLRLPASSFLWAGLLGLALGMLAAPEDQAPRTESRGRRTEGQGPRGEGRERAAQVSGLRSRVSGLGSRLLRLLSPLRHLVRPLLWVSIGALLVFGAGAALPPFGLLYQDAVALAGWAGAILSRTAPFGPPPAAQSFAFLGLSLARLWEALLAAYVSGERGARLLVGVIGVALTWGGALVLGRALPAGRQLIGWGLPLLAALTFTAVLGNSGGAALAIGIGALLLAAVSGRMRAQRVAWERSNTDYSEEIGRDVLGWSLMIALAVLLAAWIVPLWPGNPIARMFQRDDLPSGIAVLQRGMERPRTPDRARVGVSTLPAVLLGESLEQGPPEQVALRVRPDGALPEGPAPRYWRVRLLNVYTGAGWASDAQVIAQPATLFAAELPLELVAQEVEDLRADRTLVAGLADVVGVDRPAIAERLADGSLAALVVESPASRYRVLSRLMEYAPPRPVDRGPPDMRPFLGVPPGVPPRVRDLASIVSGSDPRIPPMERALLIERYLRALPYAYEVRPLPRGGDAVDQFLFEMRQGYCTYYASAMAMMARSIGIPARVAVGYATGAYDQATGAYVVREAEAHAWPELYIGDRWVIFEPTPVRPLPPRAAAGQPETEVAPAAETEQEAQDRMRGPLIWAGVLALVALATAAGLLIGRPRAAPPPVTQAQHALEHFGARAGVPWPTGATLHEYGALLAPHADGAAEALHDVVALVALARYGGRPLDQEEERRLLAASEQLRHTQRRT